MEGETISDNRRNLLVDLERCIGCLACSNICPASLIQLEDALRRRSIRFPRICEEDCTRCVEACPERAISLVATGAAPGKEPLTVSFDLIACERCGAPFVTEPILRKLEKVVPSGQKRDTKGSYWLLLCPGCRQKVEGKRAVLGARPCPV